MLLCLWSYIKFTPSTDRKSNWEGSWIYPFLTLVSQRPLGVQPDTSATVGILCDSPRFLCGGPAQYFTLVHLQRPRIPHMHKNGSIQKPKICLTLLTWENSTNSVVSEVVFLLGLQKKLKSSSMHQLLSLALIDLDKIFSLILDKWRMFVFCIW